MDQISAGKKGFSDQVIRFVAEKFLLMGNYHEAEKAYRLINDYSALKFIQRMREGIQNELYKQAEKYLFMKMPEKAC